MGSEDEKTSSGAISNLFGGDGGLKFPVTTNPAASQLSPYMNFDPSYINSQPEFIIPEGFTKQRGRFELAFSQIGGSCFVGATIGGANGFYNGLKETTLAGYVGKVKRTQLLNYVTKRGASTANTLGIIALLYSGFGVILSWARGSDDEWNTLTAATATGLLYKSSAGMKKCLTGGSVGLGIAAAYCLWNSDRLKKWT